jgi:hypothetical protein
METIMLNIGISKIFLLIKGANKILYITCLFKLRTEERKQNQEGLVCLDTVVHTYTPSYMGSRDWNIVV